MSIWETTTEGVLVYVNQMENKKEFILERIVFHLGTIAVLSEAYRELEE